MLEFLDGIYDLIQDSTSVSGVDPSGHGSLTCHR